MDYQRNSVPVRHGTRGRKARIVMLGGRIRKTPCKQWTRRHIQYPSAWGSVVFSPEVDMVDLIIPIHISNKIFLSYYIIVDIVLSYNY